ncbi:hypothetical protein GCM10009332_10220 [Shewanella gelidii]|uniref:Uncharacterized protein n=1 Tax=Shewanella gelidii TaxID=1642821 RepID=A0A917JL98_9GAMM|nr:hypothetical protein GCM10009332_10220 [Shewanella gelidii]
MAGQLKHSAVIINTMILDNTNPSLQFIINSVTHRDSISFKNIYSIEEIAMRRTVNSNQNLPPYRLCNRSFRTFEHSGDSCQATLPAKQSYD